MQAALFADGGIRFAAHIRAGNLPATGTKGLSGKVAFDLLAAQGRSCVESTLAANLSGRIAFVIGALGIAMTAIAAIQCDSNRFAVVMTGVVIAIIVVPIIVAVGVVVIVAIMVVSVMLAVIIVTVVMIALAGVGNRAAIGASATPADNADDGNCSEQIHPFLHSSILQQLIW
ncbi:MAG: hypothetical protein QGF59_29085 [Pirellulaceae bacterium]|nr:hypothetical protein [Pirellulaceae bacterium]MDP6722753.1 hypothetical protein [Pirellulaceae bacterium]